MLNIFREDPVGYVQHTAMSLMLVEQPGSFDTVGQQIEVFSSSAVKVLEAMNEPGWSAEEPNQTGFNLYHRTDLPIYLELAKTPEFARRFGSMMEFLTSGPEFDVSHSVDQFDWRALDQREGEAATVVDIGGGHGQVSLAIARSTKRLRLVVQDLPGVAAQGEKQMPKDLGQSGTGRVRFMAHDFFKPQPLKGADIYFFRWILHNWSDKYCLMILRSLVPALKKGAKVLLYEWVLPDKAQTSWSLGWYVAITALRAANWY